MNENEFELDGKFYVAVDVDHDSCGKCSLRAHPCYLTNFPHCASNDRKDKRNVIFVEKQQ